MANENPNSMTLEERYNTEYASGNNKLVLKFVDFLDKSSVPPIAGFIQFIGQDTKFSEEAILKRGYKGKEINVGFSNYLTSSPGMGQK